MLSGFAARAEAPGEGGSEATLHQLPSSLTPHLRRGWLRRDADGERRQQTGWNYAVWDNKRQDSARRRCRTTRAHDFLPAIIVLGLPLLLVPAACENRG